MTAATRALALQLRTAPNVTPAMLCSAAAVIDALLDVIESSGTVKRREVDPATDPLNGLRSVRAWHFTSAATMQEENQSKLHHQRCVRALNQYFPKDDQL